MGIVVRGCSESFSSDSSGKLDVLGHDCDSSCMDGAKVSVLEQSDQVGLSCLLQGKYSRALKSQFAFEITGDVSHQSLEGEFSNKQISGFLIFPDFSQGNCSWPESVGLLHSSGCGG